MKTFSIFVAFTRISNRKKNMKYFHFFRKWRTLNSHTFVSDIFFQSTSLHILENLNMLPKELPFLWLLPILHLLYNSWNMSPYNFLQPFVISHCKGLVSRNNCLSEMLLNPVVKICKQLRKLSYSIYKSCLFSASCWFNLTSPVIFAVTLWLTSSSSLVDSSLSELEVLTVGMLISWSRSDMKESLSPDIPDFTSFLVFKFFLGLAFPLTLVRWRSSTVQNLYLKTWKLSSVSSQQYFC